MGDPATQPIGILAMQGDFAAHAAVLARLGQPARLVRAAAELDDLAALILPGGESTTMLRFLDQASMIPALDRLAGRGTPVFGTCAGLILMAREVRNPTQPGLGLLDVVVERNGYGRQIDSFIDTVAAPTLGGDFEGVFIRAPLIIEQGPGVETLGSCRGRPVLVKQGNLLAATFHPELTRSTRIHEHLLDMVNERRAHPSVSSPALEGSAGAC